jgi:hypothetical protein
MWMNKSWWLEGNSSCCISLRAEKHLNENKSDMSNLYLHVCRHTFSVKYLIYGNVSCHFGVANCNMETAAPASAAVSIRRFDLWSPV